MKKGSKKQSNVTRVLQFFKEGDENEVTAVLILMGPIINARHLQGEVIRMGMKEPAAAPARRRRRLNGTDVRDPVPQIRATVVDDVELHKGRVAHALAHTPNGGE